VAWLGQQLDGLEPANQRPRIERIFHTALRYEYLFWEGAYYGASPGLTNM
jgi:thiaminase